MAIKIEYYGHSCFVLSAEDYRIALDPYDGHVPGYAPLKITANEVLCSHEHLDHCYREAVTLIAGKKNPFQISEFESYHDDAGGTLRGNNIIRIFSYKGIRAAHLGDMGCMPEKEALEALRGTDVVMIPVGGTYTITAEQADAFVEKIKPRIVIPMHYRRDQYGLEKIGFIDDFARLRKDVKWYDSNTICITEKAESQTAILKYTDPRDLS